MPIPSTVNLVEYQTTRAVPATESELAVLRSVPDLRIEPTPGTAGHFDLTPGSTVGAVFLATRAVYIRPKIPISRLFFLLSYSVDPAQWNGQAVHLDQDASVLEAVIPGFVWQVRRALARGPLQGYRQEESSLAGLRGRMRLEQQLRSHFGMAPPLECRYDEYTIDIEENRIIRAAITALKRLPLRSDGVRSLLRTFDSAFEGVASTSYDPRRFPRITFTRLNRHYEAAIKLSELILNSTSPELRLGAVRASTFLVDMNEVFEHFVVVGLREALRVSEGAFPQGCNGRSLFLDRNRSIRLQPDLSWWNGTRCVFIGDAKYKRIEIAGLRHADLYQLLAYTTAARLPEGMLIYAAGAGNPADHQVVHAGKTLRVLNIDLHLPPAEILLQVKAVAQKIKAAKEDFVSNGGLVAGVLDGITGT
jgi:5-methylcytosine-specific restriction enzyme subunit McrC